MAVTVAIDTLGCKVNQAESEQLARQLAAAGYHMVAPDAAADICILNTCTVTHIADRKSRHWLRLAHRRNPDATLVVTGCYAELAAADLAKIEGVKLVVANADKHRLVEILRESLFSSPLRERLGEDEPSEIFQVNSASVTSTGSVTTSSVTAADSVTEPTLATPGGIEPFFPDSSFRTRAFIKVQDGCRNFCAYCIVPFVRRNEESLLPDTVISEINKRETEGYKEVVITGVEVGSYQYISKIKNQKSKPQLKSQILFPDSPVRDSLGDGEAVGLTKLLSLILENTTIPRLRLSSLQPPEVTRELLALWQNPRLCRHFHLSLQSGSDTVLQRMGRRYTIADYARAVALIRAVVPGPAITTDIIVGFPGETDEEFAAGCAFCKQMEFARLHVFPYSPRKGTRAAGFSNPVDEKTKKQRMDKYLVLAEECIRNFSRKFLGSTMPVLLEQKDKGLWSGLTDNYIRVFVDNEEDLTNRIVPVKMVEVWGEGMRGELIENNTNTTNAK